MSKNNYGISPDLRDAIESALDALMNVPCVGDRYDQQHSDTHMQAWVDLRAAYENKPK